jgi:DNA-binding transcriptional LysR family regulator
MDLKQAQYFLAIVERGSFSAAAAHHFISQSSLSKRIIALEEELGVALFDRSKRQVSLTEAGEAFLTHAQKLNETYFSLISDLDDFKYEGESLTIATVPVITEYGITNLIADYRKHHPEVNIDIEELDGLNILPALDEHRFDLAFTRYNYLDPNQYESLMVHKDKFIVIVSKNNPLAEKSLLSLNDLRDQNFIVFDKVTGLQRLLIDECNQCGFEPTIFYSSHRKMSVFGLVGANVGIALTPLKIYEYHKTPEVTAIPLEETIYCHIVLVYRKNKKLPAAAVSFAEYIKNHAQE